MLTQSLHGALIACNRPVFFSVDVLLTLIMISLPVQLYYIYLDFPNWWVSERMLVILPILKRLKCPLIKLSELYGLVWREHVMFWMVIEGWPVYASSWAVSVCGSCGVFWWVSSDLCSLKCVCWFRRRHTVFAPSCTFAPTCIHIHKLAHFSILWLNIHRDTEVGGSVFVLVYMNELMSLFL